MRKTALLIVALFAVLMIGACGDTTTSVPDSAIKVTVPEIPAAKVTVENPQPQYNYDNSITYPDGAFAAPVYGEDAFAPAEGYTNYPYGGDLDNITFEPVGYLQGAVVDAYDGYLVDGVKVYIYEPTTGQRKTDTTSHGIWGFQDLNATAGGSVYAITMDLQEVVGRSYRPFQSTNVAVTWAFGLGDGSNAGDPNTDTLINHLVAGGSILTVHQLRGAVSGSVRIEQDVTTTGVEGIQLGLEEDFGTGGGHDWKVMETANVGADGSFKFEGNVEEGRQGRIKILSEKFEQSIAHGSYLAIDEEFPILAGDVETIIPKPIVLKDRKVLDVIRPYVKSATPADGYMYQSYGDVPITNGLFNITLTLSEECVFRGNPRDVIAAGTFAIYKKDGTLVVPIENYTVSYPNSVPHTDGNMKGTQIQVSVPSEWLKPGYYFGFQLDNGYIVDLANNVRDGANTDDALRFDSAVIGGGAADETSYLVFSVAAEGTGVVINGLTHNKLTADSQGGKVAICNLPDSNADRVAFHALEDFYGCDCTTPCNSNEVYVYWEAPTQVVAYYEVFTNLEGINPDTSTFIAQVSATNYANTVNGYKVVDGVNMAARITVASVHLAQFNAGLIPAAQNTGKFDRDHLYVGIRAVDLNGRRGPIAWVDVYDNINPMVVYDQNRGIGWDFTDGAWDGVNLTDNTYAPVRWFATDGAITPNTIGEQNLIWPSQLDARDFFGDVANVSGVYAFAPATYGEAVMLFKLGEPIKIEEVNNAHTTVSATNVNITGTPELTDVGTSATDATDAKIVDVRPVIKDGQYTATVEFGYTDFIGLKLDKYYLIDTGDGFALTSLGIYDQKGNQGDQDIKLVSLVAPLIKKTQFVEPTTGGLQFHIWMTRRVVCRELNNVTTNPWIDGTDTNHNKCAIVAGDIPFAFNNFGTLKVQQIQIEYVAASGESHFIVTFGTPAGDAATGLETYARSVGHLDGTFATVSVNDDDLRVFEYYDRAGDRVKALTNDNGTFLYDATKSGIDKAGKGIIDVYKTQMEFRDGAYILKGTSATTQEFGGCATPNNCGSGYKWGGNTFALATTNSSGKFAFDEWDGLMPTSGFDRLCTVDNSCDATWPGGVDYVNGEGLWAQKVAQGTGFGIGITDRTAAANPTWTSSTVNSTVYIPLGDVESAVANDLDLNATDWDITNDGTFGDWYNDITLAYRFIGANCNALGGDPDGAGTDGDNCKGSSDYDDTEGGWQQTSFTAAKLGRNPNATTQDFLGYGLQGGQVLAIDCARHNTLDPTAASTTGTYNACTLKVPVKFYGYDTDVNAGQYVGNEASCAGPRVNTANQPGFTRLDCYYAVNSITFAQALKDKRGRVIIPANTSFVYNLGNAAKVTKSGTDYYHYFWSR